MNEHKNLRSVFLYSDGKRRTITVQGSEAAKLAAEYWSALSDFLKTNDDAQLAQFTDLQISDYLGTVYTFETRPDVLHRLSKSGVEFNKVFQNRRGDREKTGRDSRYAYECRNQKRFERLGTTEPCCVTCPENDPRCLERHHIAGKSFGKEEVILCRNDHRKVEDLKKDHPPVQSKKASPSECNGKLVLGIADILSLLPPVSEQLIDVLRGVGIELIQSGQSSAPPAEQP
jgi:hypothetical protein